MKLDMNKTRVTAAKHYEDWIKIRKQTMMVFILQTICIGMDTSLTFLTLYLYLKKQVKTNLPRVYYSIISVSYFVPAIMLSTIIGHLTDQSRNIRLPFFIINSLVVVGNILYALPFSPWFLLVGRLLAGTGMSLRSVMAGEVARSYPAVILSNKMSYLGVSHAFGFVIGPVVNMLFTNVKFRLGAWKLTYYNIPGVYMALLFSLVQILNIFMLSNLSKLYDLKKEEFEDICTCEQGYDLKMDEFVDLTDTECATDTEMAEEAGMLLPNRILLQNKPPSTTKALQKMLCNVDIAVMLLLAFLVNYLDMCYYMWNPILIVEKMKWSVTVLGWILMGMGTMAMITCLFFLCFYVSNKFIFYSAVFLPIALISLQIITTAFYYHQGNLVFYILLWITYCFLYTFVIAAQEVILVTVIAKLVSSRYQVVADGLRLTMYRCGGVSALSVSAFIYKRMDIVSVIHITLMGLCLILLLLRRKTLGNPNIQIW